MITYRETALLANPATSSASELQRVVVVIAHELAHQWFGNLVTMEWWNSLFLNEGDASLWEYFGTQAAHPEFEIIRQFVVTDVYPAMAATWFGHSRQLVSSVTSSADIEAQFDGVSYSFGASILYQLMQYLAVVAPGAYDAGMAAYLTANAYGNAEPAAFWSSLAAAANLSALPAYMASYTSQTGYPVVTVAWVNADGAATGAGSLAVSQARHFLSPYCAAQAPPVSPPPTWWIPLTLAGEHPGAGSGVPAAVQAAATTPFTASTWPVTFDYNISRDGYVKFNVNATGYYRVNYPLNVWAAFGASITAQLVAGAATPTSPADRGNLLYDLFTFAYGQIYQGAGITMATYLQFATWLRYETAYEAWVPALAAFGRLRQLLVVDDAPSPPGCADALAAYAAAAIAPAFAALNFTGDESPLTVQLRSSIIAAGSAFNVSAIVTGCNALYAGGVAAIPANIQVAVLSSAVRWAPTSSVYNAIRALYIESNDASVKRRYITALAATRDPALLSSLLLDAIDSRVVRSQDTVSVIVSVAANPAGRVLAWQFINTHWDLLYTRYGQGGFALSNLVFGTAAYFDTTAMAAVVAQFYAVHPAAAAQLDFQQALEMIGTSAAWVDTDLAPTCAWLSANAPS